MTGSIEEEIIENYTNFEEDNRLNDSFGIFEKEQTKDLIKRYCKNEKMTILDIGGGTGAYSFWLSSLKNNVYLIDIVPKHIKIAKEKAKSNNYPPLADYIIADSRNLPINDNFADLAIIHGPLYHFTDKQDRLNSLKETLRVLKPGGTVLAFTITRYAGLNYGLSVSKIFEDIYYSVIENEILTGIRDNNPKKINSFLRSYFHLPKEIEDEIKLANFKFEKTIGILGTAWNTPSLNEAVKSEEKLNRLKKISCLLENEPVLSPKMMTVGVKK